MLKFENKNQAREVNTTLKPVVAQSIKPSDLANNAQLNPKDAKLMKSNKGNKQVQVKVNISNRWPITSQQQTTESYIISHLEFLWKY